MTKKITIPAIIAITLILLSLCACSRKVYVPVERTRTVTDSTFIHRADTLTHQLHTIDTLMLRDSVVVMVRGDTIYKEAWRIRDRVRILRDTLRIGNGFTLAQTHRDTIRQPQIVEVEKRVEVRALRWYQRALQWIGAAALLLPLLWLAARTYLRRQIPRT